MASREEIAKELIDIVVDKLGVNKDDVTPDANFTSDLGADSLDTVDLIMEIEKKYKITISDNDAKDIQTVDDALRMIEKKLG